MADLSVKFKYKFSKEYNPVYVNGAHGGVGTHGEIIMNFFLERHALPLEQSYNLVDGKIGEEVPGTIVPTDQATSFVRYVETGVVLNLQTAIDIKIWLENQIEILEKLGQKK